MGEHTEAGERLRQLRDAAGLSRDKLGALAGITGQAIYLLENGKREMTRDTARRLAGALGVSWEWLMVGVNPNAIREPLAVYLRENYGDMPEGARQMVEGLVRQWQEENEQRRRASDGNGG